MACINTPVILMILLGPSLQKCFEIALKPKRFEFKTYFWTECFKTILNFSELKIPSIIGLKVMAM